jgi:hypothetical protein
VKIENILAEVPNSEDMWITEWIESCG